MKPPTRSGAIVIESDGCEDKRAADAARRRGGPGVKPGGVRKHKPPTFDVQRILAQESVALRILYEQTQGDSWVEHDSWQVSA